MYYDILRQTQTGTHSARCVAPRRWPSLRGWPPHCIPPSDQCVFAVPTESGPSSAFFLCNLAFAFSIAIFFILFFFLIYMFCSNRHLAAWGRRLSLYLCSPVPAEWLVINTFLVDSYWIVSMTHFWGTLAIQCAPQEGQVDCWELLNLKYMKSSWWSDIV